MAFLGDYHTHTVFSHGKGSIEDSAFKAARTGLREIAVTDHGFNHMTFGVRRREIPFMRAQINECAVKYPSVKVYLGVEANILNSKGKIDVRESDKPNLDIIVCGYHKLVHGSQFSYFWSNNLGLGSAKTIARNTDAYVNAVMNNKIDILSHPGNCCKCDIREVARACKHFKTYFELNGKRIYLTDSELETAASEGCEFICDSDAHRAGRVGDFSVALARIERVKIPFGQIANFDRLPVFVNVKRGGAADE